MGSFTPKYSLTELNPIPKAILTKFLQQQGPVSFAMASITLPTACMVIEVSTSFGQLAPRITLKAVPIPIATPQTPANPQYPDIAILRALSIASIICLSPMFNEPSFFKAAIKAAAVKGACSHPIIGVLE